MKINLTKNLKTYTGLHSSVFSAYFLALAPILAMLGSVISFLIVGDVTTIGLLSRYIYVYFFVFIILFLAVDLYSLIIRDRKIDPTPLKLTHTPEVILLMCFLGYIIIATLLQLLVFKHSYAFTTSVSKYNVQEGLFAYIVYAICFFVSYTVCDKEITKNILKTFGLVSLVVGLFAIIDPTAKLWIHSVHNTNWASMFINSNHFGYYLALATPLFAMGIVFSQKTYAKVVSIVGYTFLCFISMYCDTFGSLLAIFAGLILLPFIMWWFKKKFDYKTLIPLGIFVVVSFLAIPFAKYLSTTYRSFFAQIGGLVKDFFTITKDPTSEVAEKAGTNRWGLWLKAFNEVKDSPLIGTGNVYLRPHNEYLQFAQVWGLPSVIIYLSVIVVILVKSVKYRAKISNLTLVLLFMSCVYWISAFFGNTMPHTTPLYLLILGLLIRQLNLDILNSKMPTNLATIEPTIVTPETTN